MLFPRRPWGALLLVLVCTGCSATPVPDESSTATTTGPAQPAAVTCTVKPATAPDGTPVVGAPPMVEISLVGAELPAPAPVPAPPSKGALDAWVLVKLGVGAGLLLLLVAALVIGGMLLVRRLLAPAAGHTEASLSNPTWPDRTGAPPSGASGDTAGEVSR